MSTTERGGLAAGKVRRTLHNPVGQWVMTESNGTVHECTDLVTLLQRMTEALEKGSTETYTISKGWSEKVRVVGCEVERTHGGFADVLSLATIYMPLTDSEASDVTKIVIGHDSDGNWAFHYVFKDDTTLGIESAGRGMSEHIEHMERIAQRR